MHNNTSLIHTPPTTMSGIVDQAQDAATKLASTVSESLNLGAKESGPKSGECGADTYESA